MNELYKQDTDKEYTHLGASRSGLMTIGANERLEKYGQNTITEKILSIKARNHWDFL